MRRKLATLVLLGILLGQFFSPSSMSALAPEPSAVGVLAFLGQTQDTNQDGSVDRGDSNAIYVVPQQAESEGDLQYVELTSPYLYNVQVMAWSPTHNAIAFSAFFQNDGEQSGPTPGDRMGVFVVYPGSHGILSIFEAPLGTRIYNLDWSADGQYLLYTAESPGDDGHVYVVERTGGRATQLTQFGSFARLAYFVTSPTGPRPYHILVQSGASDTLRSGRQSTVELRRIGFSPDEGVTYDESIPLPSFAQNNQEGWLSAFSINQGQIALQIALGSAKTYDWVLSIKLGTLTWLDNRPQLDAINLANASPAGLNADDIRWGEGFLTYTVSPHYPASEPTAGVYLYDFTAQISTPLGVLTNATALPIPGDTNTSRFLVVQPNLSAETQVSLLDSASIEPARLFAVPGDILDIRLAPSRLKLIAFHALDVDTNQDGVLTELDYPSIWVVDETGNRLSRLTGPDSYSFNPIWDPSGTWIAFTSIVDTDGDGILEPDERRVVEVMRADGSQRHRVSPLDQEVLAPIWSLDGKRLIFAARFSFDKPYITYEVPVNFDAAVSTFGALPVCIATSTVALNVRTAPVEGRVIGILDTGKSAQITGVDGTRDWLRISFGGESAWVSRGYVTIDCSNEIIQQYPVVQGNEPIELANGPIVLTTPETNSRPIVLTRQGLVIENGVGQLSLLENKTATVLNWLGGGEVFGSVIYWPVTNQIIGLVSKGDAAGVVLRHIDLASGGITDTDNVVFPSPLSFFEPIAVYPTPDSIALVAYTYANSDGTVEQSPVAIDPQGDQRMILEFDFRTGTTRQLSPTGQSAWSPDMEVNGVRMVYSTHADTVSIGWVSVTADTPTYFVLTPNTLSAFNPRWQP